MKYRNIAPFVARNMVDRARSKLNLPHFTDFSDSPRINNDTYARGMCTMEA